MTNIKIVWTSDEHDCDTCGSNYADGALVYFDEHLVLDLMPVASCFDSEHYDRSEVYRRILEKLDCTVSEESERYEFTRDV